MKLFCAVIHIDQKKIVQEKILYEGIPVKPLLVSLRKILELAYGDFSHDVNVLAGSAADQDILGFVFIKHLEIIVSSDLLTVRGGLDELYNIRRERFIFLQRGGDQVTLRIIYKQINFCDRMQFIYRFLYYLCGDHTLPPAVWGDGERLRSSNR